MRIFAELLLEVFRRDEIGAHTGEVFLEKGDEVFVDVCGEGGEVRRRGEESTGEGLVERRDGNEHEGAAGPDMEMIGGDCEVGGFGGNVEFTPEGVDVFLLVREAGVFHHVVAGGGVGAVGSDEEVEVYGYLGCSFLLSFSLAILCWILSVVGFGGLVMLFEPSSLLFKVRASELVVEV